MSTKIYYAYRWAGTVEELVTWLFRYREQHVKYVLAKMAELFRPDADYHDLVELLRVATEQNINSDYNLRAAAVIYLDNDEVYVQFFGIDWPRLKKPPNQRLTDMSYWNNSDRPDGVTEAEWAVRKATWDRLMRHGAAFSENGLTFNLVPPYFENEIANYVRSRKPATTVAKRRRKG
jgi:hypothetical protein